MDNQSQQNQNIKKPKNNFWKFILGFFGVIVLVLGGFFVWENYLSSAAKSQRQMEKQYEAYMKWEEQYKQAMREDTYGGKAPEETLKMFIEALKKEDIELASKYFELKEDGQLDPKWKEGLIKTKEAGKLQEVVILLLKAKPAGSVMEGYFGFEIRGVKNELISDINMRFNKESSVWKIQSL